MRCNPPRVHIPRSAPAGACTCGANNMMLTRSQGESPPAHRGHKFPYEFAQEENVVGSEKGTEISSTAAGCAEGTRR